MSKRSGTRRAGGAGVARALVLAALLGSLRTPGPAAPAPNRTAVVLAAAAADEAALAAGGRHRHGMLLCVGASAAAAILAGAATSIPGGPGLALVASLPMLVEACS